MDCIYCKSYNTRVIDSRLTSSNDVRRRRKCIDCKKRFTTYEVIKDKNNWYDNGFEDGKRYFKKKVKGALEEDWTWYQN